MTAPLPADFRERPIAHRALHEAARGRPENSLAAVRAAVECGFGIEIDVQLSRDDAAMVFHDYDLARLTGAEGALRKRNAADLAALPLLGTTEGIPRLGDVLAIVAGRVPLLIEIKDQDGALGPEVGTLEAAVAEAVADYAGAVAVMSFNPHSVAAMQALVPGVPRGLTTDPFRPEDWAAAPARLAELREIVDYERVGASFISHNHADLGRPRVAELKAGGTTILCWTVRSEAEEAAARRVAHNVTFEGYLPGGAAWCI